MATKSILKNIDIKSKELGRSLIIALEQAEKKSAKEVVLRRSFKELRGNKIKEIFGKNL